MPRLREKDARQRQEANRSPDFSEALARGLRVISTFSERHPQLTISDIAQAVDLPRATARRAIHTLVELGYMEAEGRLFRLKPKVLELAGFYLQSNLVTTVLQPICDRISQQIGEACAVAVLHDIDVVMVAHASPLRLITPPSGIGMRLPAYCSSLGRVLLAGMDNERLDAFLAQLTPTALTPRTIVDKHVLRQEIERAREQGYAVVDQETEIGFRSISVPIRRHDGVVLAALNVGGRVESVSVSDLSNTYLKLLLSETAQLQQGLH
jgi:IclR family pca regulon transcriptional regulator